MSLPEVLLWNRLKSDQTGFRFRRQVELGRFILDFYCANPKVAIEVDGQAHAFRKHKDASRDEWLNDQGILVLRFYARSVLKSPDCVADQIRQRLEQIRASGTQ
jgi:very-short-patch-repair endonuclease